MARNNQRMGRREVLGGIASASALAGIAGMSSASRGESDAGGPLDVKNGQLEMNVQDGDGKVVTQSDTDGVNEDRLKSLANKALKGDGPIEIEEEDAAAFMSKGIEKLNEAADAGEVEFGQQDGEVVVAPTAQTVSEVSESRSRSRRRGSDSPTATSDSDRRVSSQVHTDCGDTYWNVDEPKLTNPYVRHDIALSDHDTGDVVTALAVTSAASALAGALTSASVAGVPLSVVAGIISFATASLAAILANYNEGCGVTIDVNHLPLPPGPVTISSLTFNVNIGTQHS